MSEIKDYSIKYTIHGIYGDVTFYKHYKKKAYEMEKLQPQLLFNNNIDEDLINFDVEVEVMDTGNKFLLTENPIQGFPSGIDGDTYFKMALLNHLDNIIKSTEITGREIGQTLIGLSGAIIKE